MSFHFWMIGKTKESYLLEGMKAYEQRVSRYLTITTTVFPPPKNAARLSSTELKRAEAAMILQKLLPTDELILLDERGKMLDSKAFAEQLRQYMVRSGNRIIFLIGGSYGFDETMRHRANSLLSLSKMTFSHQLIRLIFWEQLYRAVSINEGLPYHNE